MKMFNRKYFLNLISIRTYLSFSFIILFLCFLQMQTVAQNIKIDTSSSRKIIVTATGTLNAATLNYARAPMALCIDAVNKDKKVVKKILLSWSANIDNAGVEPMLNRMTSMDGGKTWGAVT